MLYLFGFFAYLEQILEIKRKHSTPVPGSHPSISPDTGPCLFQGCGKESKLLLLENLLAVWSAIEGFCPSLIVEVFSPSRKASRG
jgi:hypothetical protein